MYPIQVLCNVCKDYITFGIAKIRITVSSPAMGDNTTQHPNLRTIALLPGEHHSSTTVTIAHTATCKKSIFFSFEVYGLGISGTKDQSIKQMKRKIVMSCL
jgi:hypothetical protein